MIYFGGVGGEVALDEPLRSLRCVGLLLSSPLTRLLAMRRKKMEERDGAAGVGSVSPLAAELAPTGAAAAEAQQQPPPAASLLDVDAKADAEADLMRLSAISTDVTPFGGNKAAAFGRRSDAHSNASDSLDQIVQAPPYGWQSNGQAEGSSTSSSSDAASRPSQPMGRKRPSQVARSLVNVITSQAKFKNRVEDIRSTIMKDLRSDLGMPSSESKQSTRRRATRRPVVITRPVTRAPGRRPPGAGAEATTKRSCGTVRLCWRGSKRSRGTVRLCWCGSEPSGNGRGPVQLLCRRVLHRDPASRNQQCQARV